MGILDFFSTEMNKSIYVLVKTTTRDPVSYQIIESYTKDTTPISACIYSKAIAEQYFGVGMWKEDVKLVAVTRPFVLAPESKISVDDVTYGVDSVDDVAFQGEVMLIGLKVLA